MEEVLTLQELITLINRQEGDFMFRIEFGREAYDDAEGE